MPNTLAHIGIQGFFTRAVFTRADAGWIYIGLIIPDIPWIFQRFVKEIYPAVDLIMLRSYVIVQATFFGSLLLCIAVALFTKDYWKIFLILALNALLHLVIDASQIKYANGVHFLAPFSWDMSNWGLFAIESPATYFITILGFIYLLWSWRDIRPLFPQLGHFKMKRIALIGTFVLAYFIFPYLFIEKPIQANNHYMQTLAFEENRIGEYIEFDRATFQMTDGQKMIKPGHYPDWFHITGLPASENPSVSVKGIFIEHTVIQAKDFKVHSGWFRNLASYLGLIGVMVTIFIAVGQSRKLW